MALATTGSAAAAAAATIGSALVNGGVGLKLGYLFVESLGSD